MFETGEMGTLQLFQGCDEVNIHQFLAFLPRNTRQDSRRFGVSPLFVAREKLEGHR